MNDFSDDLSRGIHLHLAGQLTEAERVYRKILAEEPDHPDALHLLGVIASNTSRSDLAIELIRRAISLRGGDAEFHNNLGTAYKRQGNIEMAAACHRRAIELKPDFAAAHFNLGNVLRELGQLHEAAECYERAAQFNSNFAEAYFGLATTLHVTGKLTEAVACYRRAIAIRPDSADSYAALGDALKQLGQFDEAILCCRRSVDLKPEYAEGYNNLGNALREKRELSEAESCYRRALELRPNLTEAHFNLATLLRQEGELDEAIAGFRRALAFSPDYSEAWNALGNAVRSKCDFDGAAACYDRAIDLKPDFAIAHVNRAGLELALNGFERGWQEYEWRWRAGELTVRNFNKPRWSGEAVGGKTVLVWAEQGLGDTIQFVRYLKMVKERGARVVFECQKALVTLLTRGQETGHRGQLGEVGGQKSEVGSGGQSPPYDKLVAEGDALPEFDFQVPLLSLPGIFGTRLETIPTQVPYLFADAELVEEWRQRLSELNGLRIGINWRGRVGKRESRQRDVPVELFASLAQIPGVRLISLQKAPAGEETVCTAHPAIVDLGEIDTEHGAFMDTAAIMMNLDLVITSDTSVAHLAGALGVPTWVALPFVPDWRWLLHRSDSPWYPTMRLFRQKKLGDWAAVFEEIEVALRERVQGSKFKV